MKRKVFAIALATVMMVALLIAPAALADAPDKGLKGLKGQAGNSDVAFLDLVEKDSDFVIVSGGAWGKMRYSLDTGDLVFNGHGLKANAGYSLIVYVDPWPGTVIDIGSGTTNEDGNIRLSGTVDLNKCGIKIWLVLTDDISGDGMGNWNPDAWLFEHSEITPCPLSP